MKIRRYSIEELDKMDDYSAKAAAEEAVKAFSGDDEANFEKISDIYLENEDKYTRDGLGLAAIVGLVALVIGIIAAIIKAMIG